MWDSKLGNRYLNEAYLQTPGGLKQVRDFYNQTPDGLRRWKHAQARPFDPKFRWVRRSASYFGGRGNELYVHDNGTLKCVFVTDSKANQTYVSIYDPADRTWKPHIIDIDTKWFKAQYVKYAGHGSFIACPLQHASRVYTSQNGIDWRASTILRAGNFASCAATNGTLAALSVLDVDVPVCYTPDIRTVNVWQSEKDRPIFVSMTYHKGLFVAAADWDNFTSSSGIYVSENGKDWRKTLQVHNDYPGTNMSYDGFKSVNGKLFLQIQHSRAGSSVPWYMKEEICLVADDVSSLQTVISETYQKDDVLRLFNAGSALWVERLPIVYVRGFDRYLLFGRDALWYSQDGVHWDMELQEKFSEGKIQAIYIPGNGLYVTGDDDLYYAECP